MRVFFRAAMLPAALFVMSLSVHAKDVDEALIQARQKFFGIENVD